MRVVLDANIYISFFISRGNSINSILSAWQTKSIQVLTSPEIKAEVLRVFKYPKLDKYLKPADFQTIKYLIEKETIEVNPSKRIEISKDKKDNIYLECALEGKADYLISGDKKHLLPLKKIKKTKILSPAKFTKEVLSVI